MDVPRAAHNCRFGSPTLFLQWPYWLDAWSWPWSCTKEDTTVQLLPMDTTCENCARWALRQAGATPPTFETPRAIVKS